MEQVALLGVQGESRECCIPKSMKGESGRGVGRVPFLDPTSRRVCPVTPTFCPVHIGVVPLEDTLCWRCVGFKEQLVWILWHKDC